MTNKAEWVITPCLNRDCRRYKTKEYHYRAQSEENGRVVVRLTCFGCRKENRLDLGPVPPSAPKPKPPGDDSTRFGLA